jgi:hypothetical protein
MGRRIMTVSAALAVALVVSVAFISVALADDLYSESSPVTVTGRQTGTAVKLTTTAGGISCTSATYTAISVVPPTTVIQLLPSFSGCEALGFPALINTNGCYYYFYIGAGTTGTLSIKCSGTNRIKITANPSTPKCTIEIEPQSSRSTVTYKNVGTGTTREVELGLNVGQISYTHVAGTGVGKCMGGYGLDGTLTGTVLVKAEKFGTETDVGLFVY